jgi:hypothetical protein
VSDFDETWIFSTEFWQKKINTKFYEDLSSGSSVILCEWTDRWWADMTKVIVPLGNFVNAPKIIIIMHGNIYI